MMGPGLETLAMVVGLAMVHAQEPRAPAVIAVWLEHLQRPVTATRDRGALKELLARRIIYTVKAATREKLPPEKLTALVTAHKA